MSKASSSGSCAAIEVVAVACVRLACGGMLRAFAILLATLIASPAGAAGFQYGTAPDPDGKPIELGIWYPSDATVSSQQLGLFTQQVAPYAAIAGQSLPLIVISHGTGGGASSHYDTAIALANAGFVVVAPSHTGDNYKDQAYASPGATSPTGRARSAGSSITCSTAGTATPNSTRRGSACSATRREALPR